MASAILVLLVIIIIYAVWQNKKNMYNSMLKGYWVGDEAFLNQSSLESLSLYVGDNIGGAWSEVRRAYLIMTTSAVVIVQRIIYMNLSGSVGIFGAEVNKTLLLRDDEEGNVEGGTPEPGLDEPTTVSIGKIMTDEPIRCEMNLAQGLMSWSDDEKVYARFFRDYPNDINMEAGSEFESESI